MSTHSSGRGWARCGSHVQAHVTNGMEEREQLGKISENCAR